MHERRKLFVLVVESDRVVAITLAGILHAAGYLVGIAENHVAALRIASRMVVDAVVIDVGANPSIHVDTAATLLDEYPECKLLLICSPCQANETAMLTEEYRLAPDVLIRPLSRSHLLDKLASAAGVSRPPDTAFEDQVHAA